VNVFVTGATGLIGRAVVRELLARGDSVTALSRSPSAAGRLPPGARLVTGDPARPGPWQDALAAADACLHLAGDPVVEGRWNAEKKRRIRESRTLSTALVADVIRARGPRVLVSGSAVGFYGDRGDEVLDERSPPGTGYMPEVCLAWEAAAAPAAARARVVTLRTGLVLSLEGGALPPLVRPFRLLAGGPLASGRQFQPCIHIADTVGLVLLALDDTRVAGPLACAVLGEAADVVLASQRVVPRKALELGFRFRFTTVESALRDLLAPGAA
jgi:hypothetical protein